ncbi:MAG: hypothetical protein J6Q68_05485 [Clostridia bacterium]|nr:hypothetical protein [Clostridia bacterium]
MKFVSIKSDSSRDALLKAISDNNFVSENVVYNSKGTKPYMHVKEKNGTVKIKCEIKGGPTKDNGFIVGTYFRGRIFERDGGSELKGIIVTAPIYHAVIVAFTVFMIWQCIVQQGFNLVIPFIWLFNFILFKSEYKKQGYIQRYLYRAARLLQKNR